MPKKAKAELESIAREINAHSVTIDEAVAKVSIVGAGMIGQSGVAAKMFKTLGDNGINIQIISTGEIHISCIIAEKQGEDAVRLIHDAFELASCIT